MVSTQGRGGGRPHKEAFFVQVKSADDKPIFFDTTDHLGKKMPYTKPLATCALGVYDNVIAFSLLKLTARSRTSLIEQRMEIPRGPLAKLTRSAGTLTEPIPAGKLLADVDGVNYTFDLRLDDNGVATLDVEGDDVSFEAPKAAMRMTLFLNGKRGDTPIAVGFIGHFTKPGSPETITRAVSYALNYLSALPVFQLVSGIETVTMPAPPTRYLAVKPERKPGDGVEFRMPVRLWDDSPTPAQVAQGFVTVSVDLETANPVTARLLYHFSPDEQVAELFDQYRSTMEAGVSAGMSAELGPDQVADLVFDISLGSLDDRAVTRMREAAATLGGLDLSPRQFSPFTMPAAA